MKNPIKTIILSCSFAVLSIVGSVLLNSAAAMEATQINPQLPKYILLNAFYSMPGESKNINDMLNFSIINKKCLDVTRMAHINPLFDRNYNQKLRIKNLLKELAVLPNIQTLQVWKIEDLNDPRVQKYIARRNKELKGEFLKIIVHKADLTDDVNFNNEISKQVVQIKEFAGNESTKTSNIGQLFPNLRNTNLNFHYSPFNALFDEETEEFDYLAEYNTVKNDYEKVIKILETLRKNSPKRGEVIYLPTLFMPFLNGFPEIDFLNDFSKRLMDDRNLNFEDCIFVIKVNGETLDVNGETLDVKVNGETLDKDYRNLPQRLNEINSNLRARNGCCIYLLINGDINFDYIKRHLLNNEYIFFDTKNSKFLFLFKNEKNIVDELDRKYLTKFRGKKKEPPRLGGFENYFENFSCFYVNDYEYFRDLINYINSDDYKNNIKQIHINIASIWDFEKGKMSSVLTELPQKGFELALSLDKFSLDNLKYLKNPNQTPNANIVRKLDLYGIEKSVSIGANDLKSLRIENSIVELKEESPSIKSLLICMHDRHSPRLNDHDSLWMNIGRIQDLINKCPCLEEFKIIAFGNNPAFTTNFTFPPTLKNLEKIECSLMECTEELNIEEYDM